MISDKLRTLLKLIPLPKKMSQTPDQAEEFNVYSYLTVSYTHREVYKRQP